jgi:hypothetical protein
MAGFGVGAVGKIKRPKHLDEPSSGRSAVSWLAPLDLGRCLLLRVPPCQIVWKGLPVYNSTE